MTKHVDSSASIFIDDPANSAAADSGTVITSTSQLINLERSGSDQGKNPPGLETGYYASDDYQQLHQKLVTEPIPPTNR